MEGDGARAAPTGLAEARQLLEIHAFLACQGPAAFQPSVAWFRLMPDAAQGALVDWLLDPAHRQEASEILGREWARVLGGADRDGLARMGSLLPCLATCDAALGFRVLEATAVSLGPAARTAFGEALLALALSRGNPRTTQANTAVSREDLLGVLLRALARIPLDAEGQARRFLALTQDLPEGTGEALVRTGLFPKDPEAMALILAEGHPRALEALLRGSMVESGGRSDLFQSCRGLLSKDLQGGIRALGRAMDVVVGGPTGLECLEALFRAALLPTLEQASLDALGQAIPEAATLGTLWLVCQVAPGLAPERRSRLCDLLLDHCDRMLREGRVGTAQEPRFVATVVQAAVLHPDAGRATARVRQMLLNGAAVFRIHLFRSDRPREDLFDAAMAFEQVVQDLHGEFRRRRSLAYSLDSVLPMVRSLAEPPSIPWTDPSS